MTKPSVKCRKFHAPKSFCRTLSLCHDGRGPSWSAYLPPSLHYSHHSAKWRQTGIDSVWVHRPTAFTRRGLELQHLSISLASFSFLFFFFLLQHGPYFLISIHLSNRFWPKSHQLLYYGATYILFVWVQLSKEVLKDQWTPHHVLLTHLMQKWSWQVLLEKSKADIDLIVALLRFFFSFCFRWTKQLAFKMCLNSYMIEFVCSVWDCFICRCVLQIYSIILGLLCVGLGRILTFPNGHHQSNMLGWMCWSKSPALDYFCFKPKR